MTYAFWPNFKPVYLILLLYGLLVVGYGWRNPLFEAPDEHHHYFTVEYIATHWQLPAVADEADGWMRQEAAQPPLYYLLGAALIAPLRVDPAGTRAAIQTNPYVQLGDPTVTLNFNAFIQPTGASYALAAHLLRLLSGLMGAGTLLCIYGSGRLLWPNRPARAWLAMALVAFLPQFLFIQAAISNDPLITLLCAATLWQLLRLWHLNNLSPKNLFFVGLTIGLAALTKNQGLLLLLFALFFLGVMAVRLSRPGLIPQSLLYVALPTLLLAGWLWWRNWQLYGDFTATNQFIRLAGGDRHFSLAQVWATRQVVWVSFVARFGWMNVAPAGWLYQLWNGLVGLALLGLLWQRPHWKQPLAALLIGWCGLVLAGLVQFMLRTPAEQGRLLFPALLPLALGMAAGLDGFGRRWLPGLAVGGALFSAVWGVMVVIPQAYATAQPIQTIPAGAIPVQANMGDGLALLAVEIATLTARPGDDVILTLYWQANGPLAAPPVVETRLLGRDYAPIGEVIGYHGRGLSPANGWVTGQIMADRFTVRLAPNPQPPTLVRPFVRVNGSAAVPAGELLLLPATWPAAAPPLAQFEGGLELVAVRLEPPTARPEQTITVHLTWQTTGSPGRDLTTFVHLLDQANNPIAQGDRPPLNGDYPTRLWQAGQQFDDSYPLTVPAGVPAGTYTIWLGLYDPLTRLRQPLFLAGQRQANDAYPAGFLRVIAEETNDNP